MLNFRRNQKPYQVIASYCKSIKLNNILYWRSRYMRNNSWFLALIAVILFSANMLSLYANEEVLRVGVIPDINMEKMAERNKPLVEWLEKHTGRKIKLFVATNYAGVVEAMVSGHLELAYFGAFTYIQASERANCYPIVSAIYPGTKKQYYYSYFITGKNSSIKSLGDLLGKKWAFGDPASTSGSLVPRYILVNAGLDPEVKLGQVIYSGGHDATVLAVQNGKVDAGAVDSQEWDKLVEKKIADPSKVRIFYKSQPIPQYPWVVSGKLSKDVVKKLQNAFLSLSMKDHEGEKILQIYGALGFGKASEADYRPLREMAKTLKIIK